MILGINPEGTKSEESNDASGNCKQLDYEDYANYLIVMSGDILGKYSVWNTVKPRLFELVGTELTDCINGRQKRVLLFMC